MKELIIKFLESTSLDDDSDKDWIALNYIAKILRIAAFSSGPTSLLILILIWDQFHIQSVRMIAPVSFAIFVAIYTLWSSKIYYFLKAHKQSKIICRLPFLLQAILNGLLWGTLPLFFAKELQGELILGTTVFTTILLVSTLSLVFTLSSLLQFWLFNVPVAVILVTIILQYPSIYPAIFVMVFFALMGFLHYVLYIAFGVFVENKKALKKAFSDSEERYEQEKTFSKFCEESQSYKEKSALNEFVLNFVANVLKANAASLYQEQDQCLQLMKTKASLQSVHFKVSFKFGEGLIGQSFVDLQIKSITSQESYMQSGIISIPVPHIIVIPAVYNQQCLAVVELAAQHAFQDLDIKTVANCLNYYAAMLSSFEHNRALNH